MGKGDTWSGRMAFELPFMSLDRKALVEQSCSYKVKKIKKKKDRTIVEIEEERQIRYRGWIYAGPVSVFVDGEGEGSGKWEIDATRGVVRSHEIKLGVNRPEVTVVGQEDPVAQPWQRAQRDIGVPGQIWHYRCGHDRRLLDCEQKVAD